ATARPHEGPPRLPPTVGAPRVWRKRGERPPPTQAQDPPPPLEPLGRVDGREREQALVHLRREHVADAVGRGLERHVGEHRRQAAIPLGNREEMLEILLTLRKVLRMRETEHRQGETHPTVRLPARGG